VALLEEQDLTREADLVSVRHGRMLVSPFTFYRAAKVMEDVPKFVEPRWRPDDFQAALTV
jgi:hypothetical protein